MTFNAGERKDIRRREKEAKLADQNRGEVLRQIMSTTSGREWVWNQLTKAGMFSVLLPTDALMMAFREGMRNQGMALLDDVMQWCPDEFIQAMREYNGRRSDDTARSDSGERSGDSNGDGRDQGSADLVADDGPEAGYVHGNG